RCRDVPVRPKIREHHLHIGTAESLELVFRELFRVADDPSFCPAEREVVKGALPGHQGGKTPDGVDSLIRVEPDSAFCRTECIVVLDTEPLECPDLPVVHPYRD